MFPAGGDSSQNQFIYLQRLWRMKDEIQTNWQRLSLRFYIASVIHVETTKLGLTLGGSMSFPRVAWTDPHLKRQYLNVVGISNLQLQRDKQPIDTITSITTGDNDDRVAADVFQFRSECICFGVMAAEIKRLSCIRKFALSHLLFSSY